MRTAEAWLKKPSKHSLEIVGENLMLTIEKNLEAWFKLEDDRKMAQDYICRIKRKIAELRRMYDESDAQAVPETE